MHRVEVTSCDPRQIIGKIPVDHLAIEQAPHLVGARWRGRGNQEPVVRLYRKQAAHQGLGRLRLADGDGMDPDHRVPGERRHVTKTFTPALTVPGTVPAAPPQPQQGGG